VGSNPYWPRARWWIRDAAQIEPTRHSAVGHNNCNHRNYLLTCGQYERLLSRAAGHCEICGSRDVDNIHGKLHIDHVHRLGNWAVRGLLCQPCNNNLQTPWTRLLLRPYADGAFYMTLVLEAGLDSITPPEPPLMSVVRDHAGRPWRRESEGWWLHWPDQNNDPAPKSWHHLIFRYGPHNLQPSAFPRDDIPLMGPRHSAALAAKYCHPTTSS
jgi:recombination endonuclease VII